LSVLLLDIPFNIDPHFYWGAYAWTLLRVFGREDSEKLRDFDHVQKSLSYIGEFALSQSRPLLTMPRLRGGYVGARDFFRHITLTTESVRRTLPHLSLDAVFGGLVLALTAFEATERSEARSVNAHRAIPEAHNAFLSIIKRIVSKRVEGGSESLFSDLFDEYAFSTYQRSFIERWVKREIQLVE
jgi:hypothetical protein